MKCIGSIHLPSNQFFLFFKKVNKIHDTKPFFLKKSYLNIGYLLANEWGFLLKSEKGCFYSWNRKWFSCNNILAIYSVWGTKRVYFGWNFFLYVIEMSVRFCIKETWIMDSACFSARSKQSGEEVKHRLRAGDDRLRLQRRLVAPGVRRVRRLRGVRRHHHWSLGGGTCLISIIYLLLIFILR